MRFLVAGSGTAERDLKAQAQKLGLLPHGEFLGWIDDAMLHSLYAMSDLCVIPSLYEPFGLVALEAMASGCPCIVADTGGLREVVPGGERVGLRFTPRDSASLAERMETRADRRRAARPAGRRGVRAHPQLRLGRRRAPHGRGLRRPAGREPAGGMIGVAGATGGLGSRVAAGLAERGVEQRLIVRDPARAPSLPGAEVVQAAGYDDSEAMRRAFDGVDVLFLPSAGEHPDRVGSLHRPAIEAAVAAGVERLVYTSFLGAAPGLRVHVRPRPLPH